MTMDLYTSVLQEHKISEMDKLNDTLEKIYMNNDSLTEQKYNNAINKQDKNVVNIGDKLVV